MVSRGGSRVNKHLKLTERASACSRQSHCARAKDTKALCRVITTNAKKKNRCDCFILNEVSRSALGSPCSAEKFSSPTKMSSTWDQPVQVTFRGVSLANQELNFKQAAFVINPRSDLYRCLETVSSLCIFLTCLIVPFQASFNSQSRTLWAFAYIFDVLFLVDVLLRFCVGYFSKGTLITDRSLIRRRYLRGKFLPDLLTVIPLDLLAFGVGTHLRWHQTLSLLRLNRILRVYRLLSFFGEFTSLYLVLLFSRARLKFKT